MGRRLATTCALFALLASSAPVLGAELTDVVDAFDDEANNPFDFHIEPGFSQRVERGLITREAGCSPATEPDRCSSPATVFNRELDYRRVINTVDFDFQFGLYRDLEFHFNLPIVTHDQRTLEYADGVNASITTVNPSDERVINDLDPNTSDIYGDFFGTYQYFDVPNDGASRSGVGDVTVGVAWSPYNDRRVPQRANLTFAFDYMAPTGTPARRTNTGVGRGIHELQFGVAASRRFESYLDPYFGFRFALPIAAGNGLFESTPNSLRTAPGARFETTSGTEIILYDAPDSDQVYSIDVGFDFGYTLEGREYGPLFDALNGSPCNGLTPAEAGYPASGPDGNAYPPAGTDLADIDPSDAACAWVVQQPGNAEAELNATRADTPYIHDGITDIEGFASVGGHVGFNLQFSRYVELRFHTGFSWDTPHFITAADAGRDRDGPDPETGEVVVQLDPTPADGVVERNPNYNLALDAVGRRFRIENAVNLDWGFKLAFQF